MEIWFDRFNWYSKIVSFIVKLRPKSASTKTNQTAFDQSRKLLMVSGRFLEVSSGCHL